MGKRLTPHRPSAPMVVSSLALFVSLGGAGYAATGGSFILGQPNTATTASSLSAPVAGGRALQVTNTSTAAGSTALALTVGAGKAPFTVNSDAKVTDLNADLLDGLTAGSFLRKQAPLTLNGSVASNGVIAAKNTGGANGLQGIATSSGASGVYGQSDGGGFGLAGRSNFGGTGVYAESLGGGGNGVNALSSGFAATISARNQFLFGTALELHTSGSVAPMTVDSDVEVTNLNADRVDGASIFSGRVTSTTPGAVIISLAGFGHLFVNSCDHANESWGWTDDGTGDAHVFAIDLANPGDGIGQGLLFGQTFPTRSRHYVLLQLSRDGGAVAQLTVTAGGSGCDFTAQAVVQPG